MRDRDLYATILGLTAPWKVTDVDVDPKAEVVVASHLVHRIPEDLGDVEPVEGDLLVGVGNRAP